MSDEVYLGISGGHTQSVALAVTSDGDVATTTVGGSLNYHIYAPETINSSVSNLLTNLAAGAGFTSAEELARHTSGVTLALPGVTTDHDENLARDCLANKRWRCPDALEIADDTWAGLFAGTLGKTGFSVVSGTGASVFIGLGEFKRGKTWKLDGYGPLLGDWGSGFRLATRFLEQVGRGIDSNASVSLVTELLEAFPEIQRIDNLQNWFDGLCIRNPRDWRVHFARVASVVTRAADAAQPNMYAVDLVKHSAQELSQTISLAFARAKELLDDAPGRELELNELPVICRGGQFENSPLYFREVKKNLCNTAGQNPIKLARYTPVVGAVLMSLAKWHPDPSTVTAEVLRNVEGYDQAFSHNLVIPNGEHLISDPDKAQSIHGSTG